MEATDPAMESHGIQSQGHLCLISGLDFRFPMGSLLRLRRRLSMSTVRRLHLESRVRDTYLK